MDWCANSLSGPFLQEPGLFEPDVVMAQLRYSGVLETVRIRKEGFPVRLPFQVFIDRYRSRVVPELHRSFSSPAAPEPRQDAACHAQLLRLFTTQAHHRPAITEQIYPSAFFPSFTACVCVGSRSNLKLLQVSSRWQ